MVVTEGNIGRLYDLLRKAFRRTAVDDYSGWTYQINPLELYEDEDNLDEVAFLKEYADNVWENEFKEFELVACPSAYGSELFVRLTSKEYCEYNHINALKNLVVEVGAEILVDMDKKQVVIIENESPLRKLIKRDAGDKPFRVFLFPCKEKLKELHAFCNS